MEIAIELQSGPHDGGEVEIGVVQGFDGCFDGQSALKVEVERRTGEVPIVDEIGMRRIVEVLLYFSCSEVTCSSMSGR